MSTFNRHALLLGEEGRHFLAGQTGVVVGLGGIGSVTAVELAHSGFGSLILADHDVLEESHRPRVMGSYLALTLTSKLGVFVPDRLDQILNSDIRELCEVAWVNFDRPAKSSFLAQVKLLMPRFMRRPAGI